MAATYSTEACSHHHLVVIHIWQLIMDLGAKHDLRNWYENSIYDQFILPHMPLEQHTKFAKNGFTIQALILGLGIPKIDKEIFDAVANFIIVCVFQMTDPSSDLPPPGK